MSATRSASSIDLIAAALVDEAAASATHRRLYLGRYLGSDTHRVHDALLALASTSVHTAGIELAAIPAGESLLIPYLVAGASGAGKNRGSQGFAARLRSDFAAGAPARVLLILDPDAVETVRSAAEDAAGLPRLSWRSLLDRAAALAVAGSPAVSLASAISADMSRRRPSVKLLDAFAEFSGRSWQSAEEIGSALCELSLYVRDPRVVDSPGARLRESARWRDRLEAWSAPGEDIEARLLRRLGGRTAGVNKVLAARTPFGIDYSRFELDDLSPEPNAVPPRFERPLDVRGVASSISSGEAVAAWLPGGGQITVAIGGDLEPADVLEVRVAGREPESRPLEHAEGAIESAPDGWTFAELLLRRGETTLDAMAIAVYAGEGSWFPVEKALAIDAGAAAFRVTGEAGGLALAAAGAILGPVPITWIEPGGLEPGRVVDAVAARQGEKHPIPLLLLGEDAPGGDDDYQEPYTGRSPDPDEENGSEDDAAAGFRSARPSDGVYASPAHALLAARRAAATDLLPEVRFSAGGGDAVVTVGGELARMAEQRTGRFNGYDLEREILARPAVWSYAASTGRSGLVISPDPLLERLSLGALPRQTLDAFQRARDAFFAALAPHGSVYALVAGVAREEALAYIESYADLVAAAAAADRYQPEFDRCLLIDSIVDTSTGERLIAPENPVSVAFYLTFCTAAETWTADDLGQILDGDLTSIGLDSLLPIFAAAGAWHEIEPSEPFLWRAYLPMRDRAPSPDDDARLIAQRLAFFLSVHPSYADPDQTLRIAVIEPGDGEALVDALRRFYKVDQAKEEYTRPKLDVQLLAAKPAVPSAIEDLLAGREGEEAVDRLVRTRATVSAKPIDSGEFSHLAFVFKTPAGRDAQPVSSERRASTLFAGALATAAGRAFEAGENEHTFWWGTFARTALGDVGGGRAGTTLPRLIMTCLDLVGGQPRELLRRQVTRMATTSVARDFMQREYEDSVWVVHLDHVLGIEAFAAALQSGDRYLIDYVEAVDRPGSGGVTATARVTPYRDAVSKSLGELGELTTNGLERMLKRLNAVSGRWALRLLRDNPDRIRERIGVVAAIAALDEYDRAFEPAGGYGVLLALEEVVERLRALGAPAPPPPINDDLLYLWIPYGAETPVIRARLIEVKYRSQGGAQANGAARQIASTREWLEKYFSVSGPARLFRGRDLAEAARIAAARAAAFGVGTAPDSAGLEDALERISAGDYELQFTYRVGGSPVAGDVVSVEAEGSFVATRGEVPGGGTGLIRLGRPVLQAIACGEDLPLPDGAWTPPDMAAPHRATAPAIAEAAPAREAEAARAVPASGPTPTDEIAQLARELDAAMIKYGIQLEPFNPGLAQIGPSVIRFRARPLGRQSLDGVARRAADIGREVGVAEGVLVNQEPFYITVDVPRREREVVRFADYAALLDEPAEPGALNFLVGMAASGEVQIADLARLPHLLIAGATGSGKSVFLRSLLCSLLRKHTPFDLSILLVDPKQVDFLPFEDLPHLVRGIVTDPSDAVELLAETIELELTKRRPTLKKAGVTSAIEFYENGGDIADLPQMVVVVDEFADLAATLGRGARAEFMSVIQRYGQLTRAFGIYLVLATQRPSVQVITGDVKANLTARVALKVQASQDSITILGHGGAEALRDKGDLLFEHGGRSERLQGFLVTQADVAAATGRFVLPRDQS